MVKVVITKIPIKHFFYYQWLILGLYELQSKKEIEFSIRQDVIFERLFLWNYKIYIGLRKYFKFFTREKTPDYLLRGFIKSNGKKVNFCYDIADTPYYFDVKALMTDIVYFKAQCPLCISDDGFAFSSTVKIPYHPIVLNNKDKIVASMLGPGWSYNIYSYKSLKDGYNKLFLENVNKNGKLMCYFGGNKGPKPIFSYLPDLYLNESHILGYFGKNLSHPNEKRAIAAEFLAAMGNGYDGRIIKVFINPDLAPKINQELFIPLSEYTKHISNYSYNLNIAGYRKSIPFRFIYSLAVGTAIITDKLAVKWYQKFENEVIETVEMGYLPNDKVNWDGFSNSLKNLPEIDSSEIMDKFEKKWSPMAFATYFLSVCVQKI